MRKLQLNIKWYANYRLVTVGGGATVRGVIAFHCEQLSFVKLFTGRSMNLRYETTDGGCIIMKTFNIHRIRCSL